MSKTPNQVIQNLENVLASLKTKTGKSQNNLTDVVNDMADKPSRATTTIAAATTGKANELKVSATNNQATGYVEGSSQSNDLTIGLSASGDTVSAKWGSTVVATQKVATIDRATTNIGTIANDTNDTLTITATNSQGTGYVVADSNKNTASKVVTLSIAKPTIDASGNVTAIATAQDNSTTPVKVSKTSGTLALGIGSLSVSGNIVTTSAGYYSSATSATVAAVSRATTSLGSTATNNKLVFTATNNQGTGYVVASTDANNATAEVTLSVSGNVVTASHGVNKISATVAAGAIEASATVNSPSITLTPSAITLANKTATISGKTQVAVTPTNSNGVSGQYYIAVEAGSTATNNTAAVNVTATAKTTTAGYLALNTSDGASASATASATISATTTTHYIPLATGSYTVSGGTLTAGDGSATASMTATGMNLGTAATVAPSTGPYIKVEGSGSVNRAAVTATQSAGYIPSATTSQEKIGGSSATSNTATMFYPITPVTRAGIGFSVATTATQLTITASNNQPAGYIAPDQDSTNSNVSNSTTVSLSVDNGVVNADTRRVTVTATMTDGTNSITSSTLLAENIVDTTINNNAASAGEILKDKTAWINGAQVTGTMEDRGGASGVLTPENPTYTIAKGYHDGHGTVTYRIPRAEDYAF